MVDLRDQAMMQLLEAEGFEGIRRVARKRLPRVLFDFVDGGAGEEKTLRANLEAFSQLQFRPRSASGAPVRNLSTTVLGRPLSFPLMIAPCGGSRLIHPMGEVALAGAARAAGIEYIFPHVGGYSISELAESVRPQWYQLYKLGPRQTTEAALARAWDAGCRVLVLTVDGGGRPNHRRNVVNGLSDILGAGNLGLLRQLPQFVKKPAWSYRFIASGMPMDCPNVKDLSGNCVSFRQMNPGHGPRSERIVWADVPWIKTAWPGSLVIKGLLRADDARRAVQEGFQAIIVSNHGGRQVDGAVPALRVLPEIVAAVDGQAEVLLDSGVRDASDVIKACALGARSVLIGRMSLYALAAGGQGGVLGMLNWFRDGLDRSLALLGVRAMSELSSADLQRAEHGQ
jgi:L-lactate dehydrogenase (cytochrome)